VPLDSTCDKAIQLAYETLVVTNRFMLEMMYKGAPKVFPPQVKLESCHMTCVDQPTKPIPEKLFVVMKFFCKGIKYLETKLNLLNLLNEMYHTKYMCL
jgi:hypothetical protein